METVLNVIIYIVILIESLGLFYTLIASTQGNNIKTKTDFAVEYIQALFHLLAIVVALKALDLI